MLSLDLHEMSELTSLLAVLELTGGERIVLRSDERPHLVVGDTRHELGTAPVLTTAALEAFVDPLLSAGGKQIFAEQRTVVEPLIDREATMPVRLMVRRIGTQMSVELQRDAESSEPGLVSAPSVVTRGPLVAGAPVSEPPRRRVAAPRSEPPSVATFGAPGTQAPPGPSLPSSEPPASPSGSERVRTIATAEATKKAIGDLRDDTGALDRMIREAVQRHATALYLRAGQVPLARISRRIEPLPVEMPEGLVAGTVTAALTGDDAHMRSSAVWVRDRDGVSERWHAFRDDKGPGLVVHLGRQSLESALRKGIPRHIKRVCQEDDGIVVVAAPETASVLEMMVAVGGWTASRRAGYVISIEPPGGLGYHIEGAFLSVRKTSQSESDVARAIQQATQEMPDVLMVALPAGEAVAQAVRAARTGCLVILGLVAPTAARAIASLLADVVPQREAEFRQSLAAWFRGGFAYRAVRAATGGWTVVDDLIIGTPDVRARLERGDVSAIERLQRSGTDGMRSLDDALATAVLRGDITIRQAASHAIDRRQMLRIVRQTRRRSGQGVGGRR